MRKLGKGKSGRDQDRRRADASKQGFLWTWSTYDGAEWTKTVYSDTPAMSTAKTGLTSGKYRLKTIFTLTDKNGKTEKITVYSDEKSIG